ncbi:MAG: thioredoxin-disulfide reductase, partial [Lachnospiraceae bacterium]|nr:thioredoxin-disulfide reductase [Lachnospiraceae bacterium]
MEVLFAKPNVRVLVNTKITGFETDDGAMKGVCVEDRITGEKQTIACDGLFEAIGLIPENEPFKDLA